MAELAGPWDVRFPPGRGAPDHVRLDRLVSWADSTEDGVRHFSGTAVYTRTFTVDPDAVAAGRRTFLDLGDVQVMARVTLNGQDLGIAWKTPYRVEATGAVRAGENRLEVAVVNLWPNRLIGDAALPEKDRIGWSTWEPFKPDVPLLPSGLIGPVRLMATDASR